MATLRHFRILRALVGGKVKLSSRVDRIRTHLPPSVRLIAVTKKVPVATIRQAYGVGLREFGESRVQEAIPKQEELQDLPDITWHFIGHLQTNKAKVVAERFDWIHGVDRLKLAKELDKLAKKGTPSPKVCLQVKVFPDPDKYGWSVEQLWEDLPAIDALENLQVRGLMAIAPWGLSESEVKELFDRVKELGDRIREHQFDRIRIEQLSMGMSGDYLQAIEAGATMVRLGRILFGDRPPLQD